jgi:hypothetical protein
MYQLFVRLAHNCWLKKQQLALGQYSIGRVGQYSVGANTIVSKITDRCVVKPTMRVRVQLQRAQIDADAQTAIAVAEAWAEAQAQIDDRMWIGFRLKLTRTIRKKEMKN